MDARGACCGRPVTIRGVPHCESAGVAPRPDSDGLSPCREADFAWYTYKPVPVGLLDCAAGRGDGRFTGVFQDGIRALSRMAG